MEAAEVLLLLLGIIIYFGFLILMGFFIYWYARILKCIPSCLERITAAFETIAKKLGER